MTLATVTATAPLQVRADGASTSSAALRLSSYTPVVNDRVVVSQVGAQLLVHGKVV